MKALKYAVMASFHSCMFSLCAHVLKTIMYDLSYTEFNIFVVALLTLINITFAGHYILKAMDALLHLHNKTTTYEDYIP